MKILIVAPTLKGIDQAEVPEVASGNEVLVLHGAVTVSHLEMALRTNQFDVVHCMQHGNFGVLEMSDRTISEERFALALSTQKNLRFVFLNACSSAGAASRVHNATGATVIFHERPISDHLAVRLASEFYNNIASGVRLTKALDDANATIARDARTQGIDFIEAHVIDGTTSSVVADRMEKSFEIMATQLSGIDERLAQVEDSIGRQFNKNIRLAIALLIVLTVAQIVTAFVDVVVRF